MPLPSTRSSRIITDTTSITDYGEICIMRIMPTLGLRGWRRARLPNRRNSGQFWRNSRCARLHNSDYSPAILLTFNRRAFMLERLFDCPDVLQRLRTNPLGELLDEYAAALH